MYLFTYVHVDILHVDIVQVDILISHNLCAYIHTYMYSRKHIHTHANIPVSYNLSAYIQTCKHRYIHACMHVHACTHAFTLEQTNKQTNKQRANLYPIPSALELTSLSASNSFGLCRVREREKGERK